MTNENPVIFYNDPNSVQVQPIVDQSAAILPAAILPVNTEEEQLKTQRLFLKHAELIRQISRVLQFFPRCGFCKFSSLINL